MVSALGWEVPGSLPTLVAGEGPSSRFCVQAPSVGAGSVPTGAWGCQDAQVVVAAAVPLGCGLLSISRLHPRPRSLSIHAKAGSPSKGPPSPLVQMHTLSVPSCAQNRFKGRECLSWNVWHEVNSSLASDARMTSSWASWTPAGSSGHCCAELQRVAVSHHPGDMFTVESSFLPQSPTRGQPSGEGRGGQTSCGRPQAAGRGPSGMPSWGLQRQAQPEIDCPTPEAPSLPRMLAIL